MFSVKLLRNTPTKSFVISLIRRCYSKVSVIGAPFNLGQPRLGVEKGPEVIRSSGLIGALKEAGLDVTDEGDISLANFERKTGPNGEKNYYDVLRYNLQLSQAIQKIKQEGKTAVTLGGDHSTAIGTITGHSQSDSDKQVCILWVDAHADINTGESSPSKNMHGMPVSFLLKELADKLKLEEKWPAPSINKNQIVYLGLRDVDGSEIGFIKDLNIKHFTMDDIDRIGIKEALAQSFDYFNMKSDHSLHVTFDIDSLDPLEAPSTGTPVRGGLTLREGMQIAEAVFSSGKLGALDLVEVNPALGAGDDASDTVAAAKNIILAALVGTAARSGL